MTRLLALAFLMTAITFVTGCESDFEEDTSLTFENLSSQRVMVYSLSNEFRGFRMERGEKRTFENIRVPDYRLEPTEKVGAGSESSERYVLIVDKAPKAN